MGNPKFQAEFGSCLKLDVGRWILDVGASARKGSVARRLEQGTHNSRQGFCVRFHRLAHRS
jgi:hypothetical protein